MRRYTSQLKQQASACVALCADQGYSLRSSFIRSAALRFDPSEEHHMLVETVRRFTEAELYPHEATVEKLDEVPDEIAADIQRKAIELGLYACNMPAELGGGGLDNLGITLVERELGRANYALQMLVHRPSN
eukprot:gene15179-biopygen13460